MVRMAGKGDYYVYQDQNYNVTALVDQGGADIEEYDYTPYGELTVSQVSGSGDYDGDGDVDATDRAAAESMGACRGANPEGACRILDLDFDADVDDDDLTLFDLLDQDDRREPDLPYSRIGFRFGHQGLFYDAEIESYQNRARQYLPKMKRFAQRNPLGYVHGMGLLASRKSNPTVYLDPSGRVVTQSEGGTCCPSELYAPGVAAFFRCCRTGATRCEGVICENIAAQVDLGPEVYDCIRLHEQIHNQQTDCGYDPQSCSCKRLNRETLPYSDDDELASMRECRAYYAQALCLSAKPQAEGRTRWHCHFSWCMARRACEGAMPDRRSSDFAAEFCRRKANNAANGQDAPPQGPCGSGPFPDFLTDVGTDIPQLPLKLPLPPVILLPGSGPDWSGQTWP